jgi:tRNA nucleotidyltransferase (CCA-adding enzyme)
MTDLEMAHKIAKCVNVYGGSCYFVGGYVRDKLLGIENKDIDIEVHGISPNQLKIILSSLGEYKSKGASFGVFGLNHYDLDISMPRTEHSSGRGHKDFEVFVDPYIGLDKACSRRDFTINAMMENVLTGELVDLYNGQEDLNNKVIRHVDSRTFLDDPLRVLRAAQFASRFGCLVAPETLQLCKSADLSTLSPERIQIELEKALLKSDKPSIFFETLREMNQLSTWFPELEALIGVPQEFKHHPEGDVWNHTMLVVDKAAEIRAETSSTFPFMMSALYHDIGKASTTTHDEKGYHSYEHHTVGASMVSSIPYIRELGLTRYMQNMIKKHMEPHRNLKDTSKPTVYCKMFDSSICPKDLILLAQCDKLGRAGTKEHDYDVSRQKLECYLEVYNERMKQPCVTGKDLIDAGFAPSSLFSEALRMAHNFQVSGTSKSSALPQVLGFMKKQERIQNQQKKIWTPQKNVAEATKKVKPLDYER